jgi:hypothetical protein
MKRIGIEEVECYPIYAIRENEKEGDVVVSVPEEKLAEWIRIREEYFRVQAELRNLFDNP